MPAVFEQAYVSNLHGDNVKPGASKMDQAEQLIADIQRFSRRATAATASSPCGAARPRSTASPPTSTRRLEAFEQGLRDSHPDIAPSQIYAYAFLKLGIPMANGAPNLSLDIAGAARAGRARTACRSPARTSRPARR